MYTHGRKDKIGSWIQADVNIVEATILDLFINEKFNFIYVSRTGPELKKKNEEQQRRLTDLW